MPKPDHPMDVRVRMALDRALECSAAERDQFLKWLRSADPEIAARVLLALSARDSRSDDVPDDPVDV